MFFKDKGVVLYKKDISEIDRRVVIFFQKYGKKNVIFKGIRKSKKRAGFTEIGTVLEISCYQKTPESSIYGSDAKIIHYLTDKKNFIFIAYLSEILLNILPENQPDEKMFSLFLKILKSFNNRQLNPEYLKLYSVLRILQISGLMPDFYFCSKCKTSLTHKKCYFHFHNKSFFCETCAEDTKKMLFFPPEIIDILISLDNIRSDNINQLNLTHQTYEFIDLFLYNLIREYIQKDLNSYKVLKSIGEL